MKQPVVFQLLTIIGVLSIFSVPLSIVVAQQKMTNTTIAANETGGMVGNQTVGVDNQVGQGGNETQESGSLGPIGIGQNLAGEFAYNGTSFDGYLKEKAIPKYGKDYLLSTIFNRSAEDEMTKFVTICMTPFGESIAGTLCNFSLSAAYEVCQALPEAMFICATPDIGNHLANQNITDGQTDKMAWLYYSKVRALINQIAQ